MTKKSNQLNLYSDDIPQKKLKEFVDSDLDIDAWCRRLKTPVLITDIYEVFPRLADWTPNFLDKKVGDTIVDINSSETDIFVDYHRPVQMSLSEYSRQIKFDSPDVGRRLYLSALRIDRTFPTLKSELLFDTLLPQERMLFQWLWYGPRGNTTGLHYDSSDNFFMQLHGQKRWIMTEPNSILNLHPHSALSKRPALSDFNPLQPDFEKFPKAQNVKFYDLVLNPASVLYIPAFWWHQVVSCNTAISVNMWCKTSILKANWGAVHLVPSFIKTVPFFIKSLLGYEGR